MSVVCVIDDDQLVRKGLANLLKSEGYEVVCFNSGLTFLSSSLKMRADCLLMDVSMPQLSGPETCRQLKAEGYDLPVIYMSAHATVPEITPFLKENTVQFIAKPFKAEVLLTAIIKALKDRP